VILVLAAIAHVLGGAGWLKKFWTQSFFGVKAVWYAAAIGVIFLRASDAQRFIYFQF
jgi:hypothetical protein